MATIDLGRFVPAGQPPRHFVHAATVGLNARFARIATRGDIRDRLGRFAYLLATAYAMRRRTAFGCALRYAGTTEELTLTQLSVTNAPVFGGPLQLSVPDSNPDDRLLDMLAIGPITPGRMLASGTAMLLGARRPVPGIRVWHAPRLHVDADEELGGDLGWRDLRHLARRVRSRRECPAHHHPARLRRHRRLTPASTSAMATGA